MSDAESDGVIICDAQMTDADSDVEIIPSVSASIEESAISIKLEPVASAPTGRLAKRCCIGDVESFSPDSGASGGGLASRMAVLRRGLRGKVVLPLCSGTSVRRKSSQVGKRGGRAGGGVIGHQKEYQGLKAYRGVINRFFSRVRFKGQEGLAAPGRRRPRKRKAAAEEALVKAVTAGDQSAEIRREPQETPRERLVLSRLRSASVGNVVMANVADVGSSAETQPVVDVSQVGEGWQVELANECVALVLQVCGGGCTAQWGARREYVCLTLQERVSGSGEYVSKSRARLKEACMRDAGVFVKYDARRQCYVRLEPGQEFRLSNAGPERCIDVMAVSASPVFEAARAVVIPEREDISFNVAARSSVEVLPEVAMEAHRGHHVIFHGTNHQGLIVVLDVDGPVLLNPRRKFCTCCQRNLDVKDADVVRVMPRAVRYATNGRQKSLWHTVEWMLHVWLQFAVDPRLVDCYAGQVQAWCRKMLNDAMRDPGVTGAGQPRLSELWKLGCLPCKTTVQSMLQRFDECFIRRVCDAVQADVLDYDGDDFLVDGNKKIAKKVRLHTRKPFNMVLASSGSKGFLHCPPIPTREEDEPGYKELLTVLLSKRRQLRQGQDDRHGQPRNIMIDAPATYGGALLAIVKSVWPEGAEKRRRMNPDSSEEEIVGTRICIDVPHRNFNFSEVVNGAHPDAENGIAAHKDLMAGWSAAPRPVTAAVLGGGKEMFKVVQGVISCAMSCGVRGLAEFKKKPENAKVVEAAREFFKGPHVMSSDFWTEAARHRIPRPPRVLLESWACALRLQKEGVENYLHVSAFRWDYRNEEEYLSELNVFKEYFSVPRKQGKNPVPARNMHQAEGKAVKQAPRCGLLETSEEMRKHMRNLSAQSNLHGFWQWREAYLEKWREGHDIATGTTTLEAMWREIRDLAFGGVYHVSLEQAEMLFRISFLCVVFRRSHAQNLPVLARDSSRLAN